MTDEGIPPTEYARTTAIKLLRDAIAKIRWRIPKASPSGYGNGGIRIEWMYGDRKLRLVVPPESEGDPYIYHERGNDYATDSNVSSDNFAFWLDWLTWVREDDSDLEINYDYMQKACALAEEAPDFQPG